MMTCLNIDNPVLNNCKPEGSKPRWCHLPERRKQASRDGATRQKEFIQIMLYDLVKEVTKQTVALF